MATPSKLSLKGTALTYNKKEIPLISGEFHYWRNFPDTWQAILDKIKAMGLKTVSTYVPWNFHELEKGEFDFTGKTNARRNLKGFIELTQKSGLYLIVRPGPSIGAEWPNGGPPDYAAKYHQLAPEFLAYSRNYLENVCKILAPAQITRGGNIILVQADNEATLPAESVGGQVGLFGKSGVFTEWLEKKYNNDLDNLNKYWHAAYKSFGEAGYFFHESYVDVSRPMAGRLLPHEKYYGRYVDSHLFLGWYAAQIVKNTAAVLRGAGIEVPLSANGWSPYFQDFNEFSRLTDLVGVDIYPMKYIEGNSQTEDDWTYTIEHIKLCRAELGYCWSAEFQGGLYPLNRMGYVTGDHFKFVAYACMANGLSGWNWYMLVNRDNWINAPINEWGLESEYFKAHKEITAVADGIRPWDCALITDVSLLVYKGHKVISPGNHAQALNALIEADLDMAFHDPDSGRPIATPALIYAGSNWLPRAQQKKILEYIKEGGILIVFNEFPENDEFGEPCDILGLRSPDAARPVGLPATIAFRDISTTISNAGHLGSKVNFFYYSSVSGEPIMLKFRDKSFTIGYKKKIGKGFIIHIGSNPHGMLMDFALKVAKVNYYVKTGMPEACTYLYRRNADKATFVYVVNRSAADRTVGLDIQTSVLDIQDNGKYSLTEVTGPNRFDFSGGELRNVFLPVVGKAVSIWRLEKKNT
ncbi:MAG: beta-galactosidase [Chitinivibrionales bacterium]|nr:beta-galactosidase [Chitinivibrionales bacterium]